VPNRVAGQADGERLLPGNDVKLPLEGLAESVSIKSR
jgi:hypothetical protein